MNVNKKIPSNGGNWLEKFGAKWKEQISAMKARFGTTIEDVRFPGDDFTDVPIVFVKRDHIRQVLDFLKSADECKYDFLADLTATDEHPSEPRFEIIYNLYSVEKHFRIRVKVRLGEGEAMPSIARLWKGADWAEREVFDMYGVVFTEHPNLRRILNDERFVGYPLRKDYFVRKYQIFSESLPVDPKLLE